MILARFPRPVALLRAARASKSTAHSTLRHFGTLNADDVAFFKSALGDAGVVTDEDAMEGYNTDWMRKYRGQSRIALRPSTTEEVSRVMQRCNERELAVVPQGGNTGLVGGSVPVRDEVVLSLSRMNKIRAFDSISGILQCDAGCVLETLDQYLAERNHTMPLDLGAKGSCHIGGNVATNAGGLRFIRFGSLHGNVVGLEVVLADGRVLDVMSTNRKDNTGYDLKQLFIGSEGTLGVITGVAIATPQRSSAVNLAFLGLNSFDDVCRTFTKAKAALGEILSAVEFMDRRTFELAVETTGSRDPLSQGHPFYMLIETSGSNQEHDMDKLESFLGNAMEQEWVRDGTLAQDPGQRSKLWMIREGASSALALSGHVPYKYDVSMPLEHLYSLIEHTREHYKDRPDVEVIGYGHVGDGNIHLNIGPKKGGPPLEGVEPMVFDFVASHRGSISAEHGMGVAKAEYMHMAKSPLAVELMREMKRVLDPKGILSPGKVLPPS